MEDMRIYVASLSDYNNGRLEGKWLDLADYSDASELMEAIQEMLDELTEKYKSVDGEVREEFAVHDYEGIPSTLASEYMGEQDFQQLYDIAEVADERGIPVEVLVERAGDTGSDDYQALADSLMFVVDGNDESDIVQEYEDQIGELGSDFWSNHIYIDDVTERVIYGEDVDRFREDILSENPDIEEAEAERQAEEMADEEAERREDLTTYLEDMGYGDEIPSFVSKDYEGAWKRSLSYDFDVINHDGKMYVFSSNYSLGGTILSGMIGAYIGYKVGRAKPQKKGFETEKKIARKIKGALTKKKMAKGGNVNTGRSWHQDRRMHNKSERYEKPMNSRKRQFADGGGVGKRKRLTKAKLMLNIYKPSGDFYMEKRDDGYIVHFTSRDASKNISHLMDKFEVTDYGKGYHGSAYYIREKEIVSKGGGIGFKVLSSKVAKRYEGKSVAPKYQGEYGKTYSKSEAKEVGDKVAGKVYAQQQGRKMAEGGGVDTIKIGTKIKSSSQTYVVTKKSTFGFVMEAKNGDKMIKDEYEIKQLIERGQLKIVNEEYSEGGEVSNNQNKRFLDSIDNIYKQRILFNIANHYRITLEEALDEVTDSESENLYEYITDSTLRMEVYKDMKNRRYAEGGGISGLNDLIRG